MGNHRVNDLAGDKKTAACLSRHAAVVQVKSAGNGLEVRSRRCSRPRFGSIIAWWRFIPGSGIGWNLTGFIFLGRRFIITVS